MQVVIMSKKLTYEELAQRVKELEKLEPERKQAERQLQQSHDLLRAIIEAAPVAIVGLDLNGNVHSVWNPAAEKMLGWSAEEVMGSPLPTVSVESQEEFSRFRQMIRRGESLSGVEVRRQRRDGTPIDYSIYASPLFDNKGEITGNIAVMVDITDRKQAEEALRNERDLIERIMETSPAGITRVDANGHIVYANKLAETILGLQLSEAVERTYNDPEWKITDFAGKSFPKEKLPFYIVKQTCKPVYNVQHSIELPDSRRVLLSINATPFLNISGEFEGMVATIEDITEKYTAEQNYQMLFREMLDGFALHEIICDDTGNPVNYRFLTVNPAFERLTGLSGESLIGKTVLEAIPETEPYWIKKYGQVALTGKPIFFENYSQGIGRYFQVTAFRPAPKQFACIFSDVTERKKIEAQLQQAQKMESIGTLAGGIAHDFNNILSSIIGFTELALDDVSKGTPLEDNLQEVYTAGKRAKDLVKQILAFARQADQERKPIQVDTIAQEALKLIRSTIPTSIKIKQTIESNSLIMGNPIQIHQLFMNLCTNAAQAIEDAGGILDVDLKDVTLGNESSLTQFDLKPGNYVKITVSDTGPGIAPNIIGSIFEPYFTTKGVGKGTGMGLSVVQGIVETHGGKITVDSELGQGTVFSIYLPITQKSEDWRPYEEEKPPSGTERILFVDDELPIAKMGSQILERLGYQVAVRTSSIEAMELFRSKPNHFDLVITDMTMPNMSGDKLAIELMNIRPDIPVILCTGYSKKISDVTASEIGIKAFAYKPIEKADLAKTVRKVLDEAKGSSHA